MSAERRQEPRIRRNDAVTVEWCDASYVTHQVAGTCIEASATGMRLRLTSPVPSGQYIQIEAAENGYKASGTVRFTKSDGQSFTAGVRFAWQMRTRAA